MNKLGLVMLGYTFIFFGMSLPILASVEDIKEQAFTVKAGSEFRLNNVNGKVDIRQWGEEQIKVIATKKAKEEADLASTTVKMEQSGNSVFVDTKYEERRYHNRSGDVDYQVMLPKNMKATYIDLVNGPLVVREVDGNIRADLVNGSIKVIDAQGNVKLKSVNGSIKASFKNLDQSVENIELQTVNGSIKLYLPTDVSASINAETMHGRVKSDFNLLVNKNLFSGKRMKGTIGAGDIHVELESVNGSIKIMDN